MKVYIGNYRKWVGPYQLADLLQYVGVSEDKCDKLGEKLSNTWVSTLCERIHKMKKRKVKVRVDHYDTWDCFTSIALVVEPLLQRFADNEYHGTPSSIVDLRAHEIQGTEAYWKEDKEGPLHKQVEIYYDDADKAWKTILSKMVWSFHAINHEDDYHFDTTEEYFDHSNHIQEGLDLFAKHFQNLWT